VKRAIAAGVCVAAGLAAGFGCHGLVFFAMLGVDANPGSAVGLWYVCTVIAGECAAAAAVIGGTRAAVGVWRKVTEAAKETP